MCSQDGYPQEESVIQGVAGKLQTAIQLRPKMLPRNGTEERLYDLFWKSLRLHSEGEVMTPATR